MRQLNKKMCGEYIQYPEKVLQFGEDNFLRAFADWQIDQLNQLRHPGTRRAAFQRSKTSRSAAHKRPERHLFRMFWHTATH